MDNHDGFYLVDAAHSRGCACSENCQAERRQWVSHDFQRILNAGTPS